MWHRSDVAFLLFVVSMSIFCLLGCAGCVSMGEHTYGTGYRDCCPQKLSQKGFAWKTWEGEAALAGAKSGPKGAVPNLWDYTIDDAEVRGQLEALPAGTIVRLHYRQVWKALPWNGSTDYRITKVEKLPAE